MPERRDVTALTEALGRCLPEVWERVGGGQCGGWGYD